ncbi:hypothetical protein HMPREF9080_02556 [Cardiobacterium valvarum F0432]|uniref:Uncharacterized protein n=1 Tax=Cardiobacterium valvarum F0432 TaxID=797473 RepID=G9ZIE6_9GAMM|nr:hypothetical protein HMPREF9080_02556 [Cardiobacterium valvarum F0432]
MLAFTAGLGADTACFAVEGFGKDAGDGGFTDAACAGEEIGVVDAVVIKRVGQRLGYMCLANQLVKVFRAPATGEYLISLRHGIFAAYK